ncbi:hypothetical protein HPP92_027755 [Vanilla planifolia]|uniref:F-box domain-containing protein n=1 Tax=Vanilla planifolia TaxID=51239 RepID=A0A835U5H1_VANPL|nr:hypothetical protein HPP92_027755 [Vanilla planifolia]
MPAILNYSDDEIHRGLLHSDIMESSLFLSLAPSFDIQYPLPKRQRVAAPFILREEHMKTAALLKKQKPSSIDALPDECLFEILRRLPRSRERCIAACVSKRWLMLLSSIKSSEFVGDHKGSKTLPDLNCTEPWELDQDISFESCGQLMRCLEAEEANDVRLAAIAVCASEGSGLNKLTIRGGNSTCKVTDLGLSAVGRCCSSLSALSMWRLPLVSDVGLMAIADGCSKLENIDFSHCRSISDKGLIAIAKKCPNLVSVTIDSCPGISNDGLQAVGRYCSKLLSISIKDCPLVGDKGISSLVASSSSSLMKIKLQNVNVSDLSLAVIGHYGKAVTDISLTALQNVTERGFWVMGNALNMVSLTSCTVSCCPGLTDLGLEAMAKGCPLLKQLCVRRSSNLSDAGLKSVSLFARMLEGLQLEECNRITLKGVLDGLLSCNARFRSLVMIKCLGIRDIAYYPQELPTCRSLRSLTIRGCPGFTSSSLAVVGKICPNLCQIDISGLVGVTDSGILPLIETSESRLVKVNLEGCVSLSDASISSLVKSHGSTLKFLNLDGCVKITDRSLLAISANCSVLKDLDVSGAV